MNKKDKALEKLGQIIQDMELKAGDRLPSERRLETMLEVSRNTLRSILHSLEARGLVAIRPGSGCYMRVGISTAHDNPLDLNLSPEKVMADQLEAAYLLLPMIAEHAADRIGERQLEELKRCSVDISRSIFQESPKRVWNQCLTFFRLIAIGTGNDFLVRTVEQVCSADMAAYDIFFTLRRDEREAIFADHIKLMHALRARDSEWARAITANYFLRMCSILEEREQIPMTDLVFRSLREKTEQRDRGGTWPV
ncbi:MULTISPECIES: GntR family transcriptional regulator [unclassified Pseudodesulfovibrio]|uniref:FadR/GntR family transcriptional regulator n=1 Tax=unclassified Pseudodesulfovibrio TaxID=2661612 RepID=UPI0013E2E832|nr:MULTISPECIES: GntR family transcriptional regulator [unclassified Pseudodesulfovibrio]MCJ2165270.1 GntR family transcriptional regulator [Pseudodesulfovibrio sp. S3-i]